MNIESMRIIFRIIVGVVLLFTFIILILFLYLFTRPHIVPPSETFWSFWLKNLSLLIAAVAFASSALAMAYNAIEQRHLRYMENYPYLEVFTILSVDPLPLPVPTRNLPDELTSFNMDYLDAVAPSHPPSVSDIEFRYCALALRNVGNGYITRVTVKGMVEVPGIGFPPVHFTIDRRFNLNPNGLIPFTLFPISGLPEYKVNLSSIEYYGYFVKLNDFDGKSDFQESFPFEVPLERRETIFYDDFYNFPAGQGWQLDFWGQWKPTDYIHVPEPSGNDHYLLLSGDEEVYAKHYHWRDQAGACQDLMDIMTYGQSVRVSAIVRSTPGTTAKIQLWCHDIAPNEKNRKTDPITPEQSWHEISMIYTSTQSSHLRVHLLYTPGQGQIHVDRVIVEKLYT